MTKIHAPCPPVRPWWRACAIAAATIAIAATAVVFAQAPDRAHTEALARRAGDRLQALQREADALASQEQTVLGDLRKLELERQMKLELLHKAEADAASAAADLDATNAQLSRLEQQDLSERPELRARLVELYKLGAGRYFRLFLSTTDVRRVGEASRMVSTLAALDRQRIATHAQTVSAMKSTRARLEQRSRELSAASAEAARASAAVLRAVESRNALVRDIDRRRDLNAQLAGELQAAQAKLQIALRELAAGTAPVNQAALPLRPFRGELTWPAEGQVRARISHPATGGGVASKGIDIAAAEGSPAVAVHDGQVAFAGPFTGFGNLVIIDHGAQAFSLYGNLSDVTVTRGARVDRGQPVGTVGESATGQAGLFFELRIDGQPVDPLQWLRKR